MSTIAVIPDAPRHLDDAALIRDLLREIPRLRCITRVLHRARDDG